MAEDPPLPEPPAACGAVLWQSPTFFAIGLQLAEAEGWESGRVGWALEGADGSLDVLPGVVGRVYGGKVPR
jgi:hypothetical protein